MFEGQTYEALLKSALARVEESLDKREGSLVMNGVAPAMAELAQLYIGLEFVFTATYLATAPRAYLIRRAADRNMAPKAASPAVFAGVLDAPVPVGARFSQEDLNFTVTGACEPQAEGGYRCRLTCERPGSSPNTYAGALIPVEYIPGLTRARLGELLIPGEEEEDTEVFRRRVLDSFQSQAFGGNQADYREKLLAMAGVGAVKIHPAWNSGLAPASLIPNEQAAGWYAAAIDSLPPEAAAWLRAVYTAAAGKQLTVGGCVKLVVMASNNAVPSPALLETVQTAVDPIQNAGEGLGFAPIGHVVQVVGVEQQPVDLTLRLTYAPGWSWEAVKGYVEAVVDGYYGELAQVWAASENLVVRISQLESRILAGCGAMITDIGGTRINGVEENLTLPPDSIPVRGQMDG